MIQLALTYMQGSNGNTETGKRLCDTVGKGGDKIGRVVIKHTHFHEV